MDAYEVVNALNQILNLGDTLDDTGVVGVKALSHGQYTTREVCRLELSRFLLYIANGNGSLTDGEVALINIVLGQEYSAFQLKQLASNTDEPTPSTCMTLMGFLSGDAALSQQNGYRTTTSTDVLINVFEAFGNLMVAFDENPVSKARCVKYISGMKSYVMKNL
jgi:hypothetical protein